MIKTKIFISYLTLIHYRESVFKLLLNNEIYDVHIGAGKINPNKAYGCKNIGNE